MLYNITITKAGVLFRQYLRKDYKGTLKTIRRYNKKGNLVCVVPCIKREVINEI